MAREKQVAAVVTEDSDLVVFGAPEIIFKLDSSGCVARAAGQRRCEERGLALLTLESRRPPFPSLPSSGILIETKRIRKPVALAQRA